MPFVGMISVDNEWAPPSLEHVPTYISSKFMLI